SPRRRPGCARARPGPDGARPRRTPTEWPRTCPASRCAREARRAMWPHAAPTPPACGSRARPASSPVEQALGDRRVGVDAAVAEEGPVAPYLLLVGEVALDDEHLLGAARGRLQHDAEGITRERRAPELEPAVGWALVPDAVHGRHVDAVGDRVRALHRLPGRDLRLAMRGLLARMPANGAGVEEHVGAGEGCQARRLGVPLVPAHEGADPAGRRVEGTEAEVAGREVEL